MAAGEIGQAIAIATEGKSGAEAAATADMIRMISEANTGKGDGTVLQALKGMENASMTQFASSRNFRDQNMNAAAGIGQAFKRLTDDANKSGEDAKKNAQLNEIDNVEFYVGDMKKVFTQDFIDTHGQPDVIITDPPRDGMHKDVVAQIISILPKKIVYVSCNSATQARDLALLDEHYKVTKVQPVDMFPQTHHVENVVRLELR